MGSRLRPARRRICTLGGLGARRSEQNVPSGTLPLQCARPARDRDSTPRGRAVPPWGWPRVEIDSQAQRTLHRQLALWRP
eukprot:scaffold2963_cov341-Prasinococcus_capsulatus_cf.AAC.2